MLRPKEGRPKLGSKLRIHTVLRCPLNGHQVGACRGLCTPSPEGDGLCGRLAPHALIGRTQAAIAEHREGRAGDTLRLRQSLPRRAPRAPAPPEEARRGFSS
ncbi:MAG: hypothetical protein PVJ73_00545 [Acidobacteriota bacterium]